MNFWEKLKQRWEVENNWQIFWILVTFAVTGSTVARLSKYIFPYLGVTEESSFWYLAFLWIFVMTPIYMVLIIIFGTIFGQKRFFLKHQKKMLSCFKFWKS